MNRKKQKAIARSLLGENARIRYFDNATREITPIGRLVFRESLKSANLGYYLEIENANEERQIPLDSIRGVEYDNRGYYFLSLDSSARTNKITLDNLI